MRLPASADAALAKSTTSTAATGPASHPCPWRRRGSGVSAHGGQTTHNKTEIIQSGSAVPFQVPEAPLRILRHGGDCEGCSPGTQHLLSSVPTAATSAGHTSAAAFPGRIGRPSRDTHTHRRTCVSRGTCTESTTSPLH
ncbi:hypothetical protein NDU88_001030 [Pleurodeles waltl]|uniref:Uncharacterized protein n=1 Tax=Pleurodeles waltl TaxID=8319 RepID=A0AAV7U5E4_PLEWA|nr:hypothetical protein NDU88_001030 [Pleurodeles waltl]